MKELLECEASPSPTLGRLLLRWFILCFTLHIKHVETFLSVFGGTYMFMNFPTRNQKVQPYSSWKGGKLNLDVSGRSLSLSWSRCKNQCRAIIKKRFKPQSLSKWLLGFIIAILKQIKDVILVTMILKLFWKIK
jgi:hypothetical protein